LGTAAGGDVGVVGCCIFLLSVTSGGKVGKIVSAFGSGWVALGSCKSIEAFLGVGGSEATGTL
jgi:hypothetical protein